MKNILFVFAIVLFVFVTVPLAQAANNTLCIYAINPGTGEIKQFSGGKVPNGWTPLNYLTCSPTK